MHEAVETALQALALWQGHDADAPPPLALVNSMVVKANLPPRETLSLVAQLREGRDGWDDADVGNLFTRSEELLAHAASILESVD